jgi:hypothetical protein
MSMYRIPNPGELWVRTDTAIALPPIVRMVLSVDHDRASVMFRSWEACPNWTSPLPTIFSLPLRAFLEQHRPSEEPPVPVADEPYAEHLHYTAGPRPARAPWHLLDKAGLPLPMTRWQHHSGSVYQVLRCFTWKHSYYQGDAMGVLYQPMEPGSQEMCGCTLAEFFAKFQPMIYQPNYLTLLEDLKDLDQSEKEVQTTVATEAGTDRDGPYVNGDEVRAYKDKPREPQQGETWRRKKGGDLVPIIFAASITDNRFTPPKLLPWVTYEIGALIGSGSPAWVSLPLDDFLRQFEYPPVNPPTAMGTLWQHKEQRYTVEILQNALPHGFSNWQRSPIVVIYQLVGANRINTIDQAEFYKQFSPVSEEPTAPRPPLK